MSDVREGNLNLIQLQKIVEIDVDDVIEMFIKSHQRRMFQSASILYDSYTYRRDGGKKVPGWNSSGIQTGGECSHLGVGLESFEDPIQLEVHCLL